MDLISTRTAANTITPEEKPVPKYGERLLDFYAKKSDSWSDEYKDPERIAQDAYSRASDNNAMDYDTWKAFHGVNEFIAKAPTAVAERKEKEAWDAAQPEERGFLSGSAAAIGRGVMNTVGATGQAIGLADLGPASIDTDKGYLDRMGEGMTKWAEDKKATTQFMRPTKEEDAGEVGMVKAGWEGALESLPLTGGVAASAAAGAGVGSLAGPVGTAVGATVGGLVGMAGLFGAGTYGDSYDRTYKELKEKRPDATEDEVRAIAQKGALIDAGLETGSELVSDLAAVMTLGGSKMVTQPLTKTLKEIVKPGFKTYLLNTAKHMPFEVGSEVATAYGQADWREKEWLDGGDRVAAMGDAVLPAIFMSAVLGTAVAGYREATARKTLADLNADDQNVRVKAAEDVAARIVENTEDKEIAQKWVDLANERIASGEKFDIDQTVTEWAATKTREDAQAEGRKLATDFDPKDIASEGIRTSLNPKSEAEKLLVGDDDVTPEELLLGKAESVGNRPSVEDNPSTVSELETVATAPNPNWLDQEEAAWQREQDELAGVTEDLDAQWANRADERNVAAETRMLDAEWDTRQRIQELNAQIKELESGRGRKTKKRMEAAQVAKQERKRLTDMLSQGQNVATSPQVTAERPASSRPVGSIPVEPVQNVQELPARGTASTALTDTIVAAQRRIANLEKLGGRMSQAQAQNLDKARADLQAAQDELDAMNRAGASDVAAQAEEIGVDEFGPAGISSATLPSAGAVTAPVQAEASTISEPPTLPADQRTQEQAGGMASPGQRPTIDEQFDAMVKDAARWQGAARNLARELKDDKRASVRLSKITTKGDLDAYLMRKYGIDAAEARSVSNHLTARDIKPDFTATVEEFKDEPWAQEMRKEKPAATTSQENVADNREPEGGNRGIGDQRDKHFIALIKSKAAQNKGNGIYYFDEKFMTPARVERLQTERDKKDIGKRVTRTDSFEFKHWSEVTGDRLARGYAVLDRRERNAERQNQGATNEKERKAEAQAVLGPQGVETPPVKNDVAKTDFTAEIEKIYRVLHLGPEAILGADDKNKFRNTQGEARALLNAYKKLYKWSDEFAAEVWQRASKDMLGPKAKTVPTAPVQYTETPSPEWVQINRDKTVEANIPEAQKEKLTLKQQKAWLLAEIDKAIASGRTTGKPFEFHVPGDGHHRVPAAGLAEFKKRVVERFPERERPSALGKNPPRPVQSSKGRIAEGEYYNEWQDYEVKIDAIFKSEEKVSPFPAWDAKTNALHNGSSMIVLPKKPTLNGLKESKADTESFLKYSAKEISERAEIVGQFKRMGLSDDDEHRRLTGNKKTKDMLNAQSDALGVVFAHVRYGDKDAFFPADKVDMLRTQYPNAEIRVSKNSVQLGFFEHGKVVGVTMGYEGVELSDYHKARMEEIAAAKEGRTPKVKAADAPVETPPLTKEEQEGVDLLVSLAKGETPQQAANNGMRKATKAGLARVAEAKKAMAAIVNNPDIVGKDRADRIENARNLVNFLETNAANDLDTGYEFGDKVAYTGDNAPDGMRAFIYLEGAKAGKTGVAATKEAKDARATKAQDDWQKQQGEFARLKQDATKSDAEQAKPVTGSTRWFVDYSDTNKERTTETKSFATLAEAREFAKGKSGYISKQEDTGNGYQTDKVVNTFKEYFGDFDPSAQEGQKMKAAFGEVPVAKAQEEKAKSPAKPQESTGTADAGQELTYNKRNRLNRGLSWSDLKDMNATLRTKEAVKSKIIPKPDYQAMIDEGTHPAIVHIFKQVYDFIAAKPKPISRTQTEDEAIQLYIDGANRVMDEMRKWATDGRGAEWVKSMGELMLARNGKGSISISELRQKGQAAGPYEALYPNGWREAKDEINALGSNRYLRGIQMGEDELIKAMKDIDKGWPGTVAAWKKQGYSIVKIGEMKPTFYVGEDNKKQPYVYVHFREGRNTAESVLVRGATSATDTRVLEAVSQGRKMYDGKFALLSKGREIVSAHETEADTITAAESVTKKKTGAGGIKEEGYSVEASDRTGVEHRMNGEDVTSEQLMSAFGFKGVNFGNWMKGKSNEAERQMHINMAYDSFMDLAQILNVPPKAMSLNGLLGLAIGAQGTGSAAAHFVPGVNEINLTRASGAGAVAHEWAHGLDHYFANIAGLSRSEEPFVTEHAKRNNIAIGEVRPEVMAKFAEVVKAMDRAPMSRAEIEAQVDSRKSVYVRNIDSWLKSMRQSYLHGITDTLMVNKNGKPVNFAEEFDRIAARIRIGDVEDGKIALGRTTFVSPVVAELRDLYMLKKVGNQKTRAYSIEDFKSLQANVDSILYYNSERAQDKVHEPQTKGSDYANESLKADKDKKGKRYWSTKLEMFARAFAGYVYDRLEAAKSKNSYLVRPSSADSGEAKAYAPVGEDRKRINAAFDALVKELKTKETDKGVALYQTAQSTTTSTPSPIDLRAAFPWADSIEEVDGRTIITKGKVSFAVEQVERISPDEVAFKLAYGRQFDPKTDQIAGDYRGGTIRISKVGDNWTAKHEHYHFLEDMGLVTKFEQAVLDAAIKKADKAGTLGFALTTPAENRAYFVQHAMEKRDFQRKTTLGRVFQKVADFVDALVNLVHRTSRGVVRDVESGRMMTRPTAEQRKFMLPMLQAAYHGTVHRGIEKFVLDKIGTGEGSQVFGYGLYFTSRKEIAEWYRDQITAKRNPVQWEVSDKTVFHPTRGRWMYQAYPRLSVPGVSPQWFNTKDEADAFVDSQKGQTYKVDIPDDTSMLHWDKTLDAQPTGPKKALTKAIATIRAMGGEIGDNPKGNEIYFALEKTLGSDKAASESLNALGVVGIKYLDGISRGAGDGTFNFVIFDENAIEILETYYQVAQKADITETPAFKKWFGKSKSHGVFYHWTNNVFDSFSETSDIGFHFGTEASAKDRGSRIGGAEIGVEPVEVTKIDADTKTALSGPLTGTPTPDLYALLLRKLDSPRPDLKSEIEKMTTEEIEATANEYRDKPDSPKAQERASRAAEGSSFRVVANGEVLSAHKTAREARARADKLRRDAAKPMAVYLRVENPIRLPDLGVWPAQEIAMESGFTMKERDAVALAGDERAQYAKVRETLMAKGYDGIVYTNQVEDIGSESYIVFEPTQIKSVDNLGTFDGSDPRIQYALAPTLQKAKELTSDIMHRPEVFGRFKWINTQLHKALRNPAFKRIFDRFHAAAGTQSRSAARAAGLAKDILPDYSGNAAQTVKRLFSRTADVTREDMRSVSKIMSMETLAGKNASPFAGHRLTDAELESLGRGETVTLGGNDITMTAKQLDLYRQARAALDQMLNEMATSEAWKVMRGVLPEDLRSYWEVFANNPDGVQSAMESMLETELRNARTRAEKAERDALSFAGASDMDGFAEHGKLLVKLNKAIDNKSKFSKKQLEDGDLDEIIARREEKIDRLADELGITPEDAEENLAEFKRLRKNAIDTKQHVENVKDAQSKIADVFDKSQKLIKAGYAPLSRFGKYRIDVHNDEGKLIHVSFYDTSTEANRGRRALVAQFADYPDGGNVGDVATVSEEDWKLFQGANPEALRIFAQNAGADSDEAIQAYYQDAVSSRSALKRLINRKGYAGYSDDLQRILASFVTSGAKRVSANYHAAEIFDMVNDKTLAADLRDEANKLKQFVDNPGDAGSGFRAFAANWYMLGSFMSAAWNGTQVISSTLPELYKHSGSVARSAKDIGKAYKSIFLKHADLADSEKAALKKAMEDGTVDAAEVHHLYAQASKRFIASLGDGAIAEKAGAILRLWGMPFAWFETINRKASFLAAYRMAEDQGMDVDEAYEFAKQIVDITQGIYVKHNRPNVARSAAGGAILTFMQYRIMTLEQIARNAKEGGQARKAAALQLAIIMAMGGWAALPLAEDLMDIFDAIMQVVGGKAWLTKKQLREAIEKGSKDAAGLLLEKQAADAVGKVMADFMNIGIVSTVLPVNVAGRAGFGNVVPLVKLLKPSTQYRDSEVFDALGVPGSMAQSLMDASSMLLQGDVGRAAMRLAPNALAAVAKGVDIAATGEINNTRGRKVTDGSILDAAIQTVGGQPSRKADINNRMRENQELKYLTQQEERSIVNEWADAYEKKGVVAQSAALKAVRERISDWNRTNPDWPIAVKQSQVMRELQNRRKTTVELATKSAPKELRKSMAVE